MRAPGGIVGEIVDRIGIVAEVEQFDGVTFTEAEIVIVSADGFQQVLGRAAVDISKVGLGIAGRPPIGMEILHVKKIAGAKRAHGVTEIVGAAQIVALLADQHRVAVLDPAGAIGTKQAHEAAAGHLLVRRQAGQLEEGRRKIPHVDEVLDDPSRLNRPAPAHGERKAKTIFMDLPLHVGERHAVIGRDDHQRGLE